MAKQKITKALIPAAGLGTRFLPATIAQPKEMLIIVDKPVIQFVVEEAVEAGIKDILIVTGRSKRAIEDHFDPSSELENMLAEKKKNDILKAIKYISNLANLHFVRQKRQLGLADAIYQGKSFMGDDPFVVLLGDTLIKSNGKSQNLKRMIDIYDKTGKSCVAVEEVPNKLVSRYGVIKGKEVKDGVYEVSDLVEKPSPKKAPSNMVIASRYIFGSEIFSLIEKTKAGVGGEIQITDSMRFLAAKKQLMAYKIDGKRYDIGNKVDFVKTNIEFALERDDTKDEIKKYISQLDLK
jgi:UTP--glucose-1-phosphate uridylyltransferase